MNGSGIAELTGAPVVVEVGGRAFRAGALALADWGSIQAWYSTHVASPIGKVAIAIAAADQARNPIPAHLQTWMFETALAIPFPPRIGTTAWIQGLDETEGGIGRFLFHALAPSNPDLTIEDAEELAEAATVEELQILQCVAFTGRHPDPKSGGSTGTTNPDGPDDDSTARPGPTTRGPGSSTPSAPAAG